MPRTPRKDFEGAGHHVYGRGNQKQAVFRDDEDCDAFLRLILRYKSRFGIEILAYCLMVNHYHLALVSQCAQLSEFMGSVLGAYSRRFNDRWNLVGHVFQGRFDNRVLRTDGETLGAIRYVHLNPVEAKLAPTPDLWPWSSAGGYLNGRDSLVNIPAALSRFGGLEEYAAFMAAPRKKDQRPSPSQIAEDLLGPAYPALLGGSRFDTSSLAARRDFAVLALSYGYRRSAIAKFLGCTPGAITKVLAKTLVKTGA